MNDHKADFAGSRNAVIMSTESEKNWWTFSVDPQIRHDVKRSRFTGAMDVNPEMPGGLRRLDYREYLGLDRLLASQRPSSHIPDERAFIVTHQLMEIVFKLIVFDMAVAATTLEAVADATHGPSGTAGGQPDDDFWRPSLTATARISFACRELLP